jgi:sarcosine oxidase
MRITVVGGGVIGLLTAVECARAAGEQGVERIDLVDAGPIPSPSATSNDRLRVVRALHRGNPALTLAAAGVHTGWLDVESVIGGHFYHPAGALTAMPAQEMLAELALLTRAGVRAWALSPKDLAAWYPQVAFPPGSGAVLEATAGPVLADHALVALARWLTGRRTVRLHPHRQAVEVTGHDDGAVVRFADGETHGADRIVVATGPWSRGLVPAWLAGDLTLFRQTLLSYRPAQAQRWTGMPAVIGLGPDRDAWMMPSVPHSDAPVRLSAASACRPVDRMPDRAAPEQWRRHLVDAFTGIISGFDPDRVVDACDGYYLAERDHGGPLLATYGGGSVWAYAACGGMSFKFAPLIARAIADHALGRAPRPTGLDPIDRPRQLAVVGEE